MMDAAAVRNGLGEESRAVLDALIEARPTVWIPDRTRAEEQAGDWDRTSVADSTATALTPALIDAAEERFRWFASLFEELFPETRAQGGVIESPLKKVASLSHALAVSGSVKSRGGTHEVLEVALEAARDLGIDLDSGPLVFLEDEVWQRMSVRRIVVGSTGNLGMSIGLMGTILGFSVTVHMSHDAKVWKKDTLWASGVEVFEHDTDFTRAVHAGRAAADADPRAHFIDDENSISLFAGYAVAGRRLAGQLATASVVMDEDHPLTVHLPCGIAVTDLGLGALTVADGLAVGTPSGIVGKAVGHLLHGYATVTDDDLLRTLAVAKAAAGLRLEPSVCEGLRAAGRFSGAGQASAGPTEAPGMHIAWLTGGSLVPDEECAALLETGRRLLRTP